MGSGCSALLEDETNPPHHPPHHHEVKKKKRANDHLSALRRDSAPDGKTHRPPFGISTSERTLRKAAAPPRSPEPSLPADPHQSSLPSSRDVRLAPRPHGPHESLGSRGTLAGACGALVGRADGCIFLFFCAFDLRVIRRRKGSSASFVRSGLGARAPARPGRAPPAAPRRALRVRSSGVARLGDALAARCVATSCLPAPCARGRPPPAAPPPRLRAPHGPVRLPLPAKRSGRRPGLRPFAPLRLAPSPAPCTRPRRLRNSPSLRCARRTARGRRTETPLRQFGRPQRRPARRPRRPRRRREPGQSPERARGSRWRRWKTKRRHWRRVSQSSQ